MALAGPSSASGGEAAHKDASKPLDLSFRRPQVRRCCRHRRRRGHPSRSWHFGMPGRRPRGRSRWAWLAWLALWWRRGLGSDLPAPPRYGTGGHGVDTDAGRTEFCRPGAGQGGQGGLRCAVGAPGPADLAGPASDVDDAPTSSGAIIGPTAATRRYGARTLAAKRRSKVATSRSSVGRTRRIRRC